MYYFISLRPASNPTTPKPTAAAARIGVLEVLELDTPLDITGISLSFSEASVRTRSNSTRIVAILVGQDALLGNVVVGDVLLAEAQAGELEFVLE